MKKQIMKTTDESKGPRPVLLIKFEQPLSMQVIENIKKSMGYITEYLVLIADENITGEIISDEVLHGKESNK